MKTIIFPNNLTIWQKEFLTTIGSGEEAFRNQTDPVLVIAPRQCFKSSTVALLMIKASLELVGDSVYISLTLQQSRAQLQDIIKFLEGSNLVKQANYQTMELTFVNGSRIYFRSAQQKDSLRGLTAENLLVMDECCWFNPDFIMTALPLRRVKKALTIFISSPFTSEGFVWDLYNNPNTRVFNWSKYVPLIYSKEELERLKSVYSPMRYLTEILGQFAPANQGLLFTNIKDCVGEFSHKDGLQMAVDCSSSEGGDYTAISIFNRDYEMVDVLYDNTKKPTERVEWVARIANSYNVSRITVEKNNMGGLFISMLKKLTNIPIKEWNTTNKSKRDIIEFMQTLFEQKKIKIINNPELIKELQCFQAIVNQNGTVSYAGKNAKDDLVMSTAICLWAVKSNLGNYNIK